MSRGVLIPCGIALAAGVAGLAGVLPGAIEHGYGELPLTAIPITAWAMWLGHRYRPKGPGAIPAGYPGPIAAALFAATSLALGAGWVAALAIAPAVLFALRALLPPLATPRVLFLLAIAPTELVLDQRFGLPLREGTARAAATIAALISSSVGDVTGDTIRCGLHDVIVTPACSGARLAVRMVVLAGILAVLKPNIGPRRFAALVAAALAFAAFANVGRISAVCVAAPRYLAAELDALELYHDLAGLLAFVLAYLLLGALASILGRT